MNEAVGPFEGLAKRLSLTFEGPGVSCLLLAISVHPGLVVVFGIVEGEPVHGIPVTFLGVSQILGR